MRVRNSYSPALERLERRLALSHLTAVSQAPLRPLLPGYAVATAAHRPILTPDAAPSDSSFIDPTVAIRGARNVAVAGQVYIGPFVILTAGRSRILVGHGSDLQDNVSVDAHKGSVAIGSSVAVAHGATILGPASIGAPGGAPTFIGFNAVVDGATVEPGAMVLGLARVAPGIVIPSGFKVLPGKFVQTQAEAQTPSLGKVAMVNDKDQKFIAGVLAVNEELAQGYIALAEQSPAFVRGVSPNPATTFNPVSTLPELAGQPTLAPRFRDRIIGAVVMDDSLATLKRVLGHSDSIRADEGSPFLLGPLAPVSDRVTIHALVGTAKTIGANDQLGFHAVIHGGPDVPGILGETTVIGDNVTIGPFAVVYASRVGSGAVIGAKAYIEKSTVPPGAVIPPGTILINNQPMGTVEW